VLTEAIPPAYTEYLMLEAYGSCELVRTGRPAW
jgi:hypothetical protein